ncbi:hypothetical protein B0H11DRAFT_2090852 [Mycena galericulata]|nr:hypothetical protein B0H11DRAFT_2090852 [Mycena galericulata]
MPPTIVKTEPYGDNPMDSDPYVAAAAALEQAQCALSTARGQPPFAATPVAEAEAQLNDLRSRILRLEGDVDRYRRACVNLSGDAKERDDARIEVESKAREMADLKQSHEKYRAEIAASLKEEREGLQRERDNLTKEHERLDADRVALEAEKKTILEIRTFVAEKLQSIDQLVAPNPLPQAPQAQADTPIMTAVPSRWTLTEALTLHAPSRPAMLTPRTASSVAPHVAATSDAVSSLILQRRRPAPDSATSQSAHPPKRHRTENPASTSASPARPPSRPRQVAPGPSTLSRVHQPHEGAVALALRARIPFPFQVRNPLTGNPFASPSHARDPWARTT